MVVSVKNWVKGERKEQVNECMKEGRKERRKRREDLRMMKTETNVRVKNEKKNMNQ